MNPTVILLLGASAPNNFEAVKEGATPATKVDLINERRVRWIRFITILDELIENRFSADGDMLPRTPHE
jgi:hypothetical protein